MKNLRKIKRISDKAYGEIFLDEIDIKDAKEMLATLEKKLNKETDFLDMAQKAMPILYWIALDAIALSKRHSLDKDGELCICKPHMDLINDLGGLEELKL